MIWFYALRKSREFWLYGHSRSDLTPLAKALTSPDYANEKSLFPLDPIICISKPGRFYHQLISGALLSLSCDVNGKD